MISILFEEGVIIHHTELPIPALLFGLIAFASFLVSGCYHLVLPRRSKQAFPQGVGLQGRPLVQYDFQATTHWCDGWNF